MATADLAAALLKARANPNIADASGCHPADVAIQNGQPQLVELLLDKGADASMARMTGETALMRGGCARLGGHGGDAPGPQGRRECARGAIRPDCADVAAAGLPQVAKLLLAHMAPTSSRSPGAGQ